MKGDSTKKRKPASHAPRAASPDAVADEVLKTLGFVSTAALVGVPENELAIVAAAVLGGICGPNARIDTPLGPMPLEPLDVVLEGESSGIRETIDLLTYDLGELQRRLIRSMNGFDQGTIRLLAHGPAGKQWEKKSYGDFTKIAIEAANSALYPAAGKDGFSLDDDVAANPAGIRMEAITHPRFLLLGCPERNLAAVADDFHRRHVLLALRPEPLVDQDPKLPALIRSVLELASGAHASSFPSRGIDSPATVRAVMALGREARLTAHDVGLFGKFLLVPRAKLSDGPMLEPSPLPQVFGRIAEQSLDERRNDGIPFVRFDDPASMRSFFADFASFKRECALVADGAGLGIVGLPGALFRLLVSLCGTEEFGTIPEEKLVAATFALSRQALRRHAEGVENLRVATWVRTMENRASQMVEKIAANTSEETTHLPARTITRKFDQQKRALYQPLFEALVHLNVLDQKAGADDFGLGDVSIDEVEVELRSWLADYAVAGDHRPSSRLH